VSENKRNRIDEKKRFSQSLLWQLQLDYYNKVGVNAWRKRVVPHVITSNTFIADQYVRLVYAFLRDWEAEIDKDHPVYLVELGTGAGRFSYHFMHRWLERVEEFGDLDIDFRFVLTDFTDSNLKFWNTHPLMKEMVQRGIADFALFDAINGTSLTLEYSGTVLDKDTLVNPLIVVANYLFDSIPQDIFYVEDNTLHESLVSLETDLPADHEIVSELLESIDLSYDNVPIAGDYYENPDYNRILDDYRQQFNKTYFRFPITGLDCCVNLQQLSNGSMMLITADKGFTTLEAMDLREPPTIAVQGSLSMMVNFHALESYFDSQDGRWLKSPFQPLDIAVNVGLLGEPDSDYNETAMTYADSVASYGADDYHNLKVALHDHYDEMTIQQMLSVIRMGRWDSVLFEECFPHLLQKVQETTDEIRLDIRLTMRKVWEHYYFIGEDRDIPFMIGVILHNIGAFRDAIILFNYSLQMHGNDPSTLYNMGMAYLYMGVTDKALELISQAADSGQFPKAVETREMILAKLNESQ